MEKKNKPKADRPTYDAWQKMRCICFGKQNPRYAKYGGRGIRPCDSWKDYHAFERDMGIRPEGTTLQRRDQDKNFDATNCYWCKKGEAVSSRAKLFIEHNGKRQSIPDWARELGMSGPSIRYRLGLGLSTDEILNPKGRNKGPKLKTGDLDNE